uniref:Uncharacterized protein n=1 Tax=Chenopodium quinoa TaxID=63459 RepID=A0A803L6C1_CHEQI
MASEFTLDDDNFDDAFFEERQECSELKKQNAREQQLKLVHVNKKSRTSKSQDHDTNGISLGFENANATANHAAPKTGVEKKSTGIQTDKGDESLNPSTSGTTSTDGDFSSLLSIWSPLSSYRSSRNFVVKLIEACASDFCDLFACLGSNMTSKLDSKCSSHISVPGKFLDLDSAEVSRVSQLYAELTKIADDRAHINAFLAVLLDLCSLENALVVCRSLRILRIALDHILSIDRTCPKRDNVKVKRSYSGSDAVRIHDSEVDKSGGLHDISGDDTSPSRFITACKNTCIADRETLSFLCQVDWLHLFMSMREVVLKLKEEHAKVEAVSIMNIILMRTDPCSARAKFGNSPVFETVALLLRKEAGFFCRKEAVHLLYLLLNCPTILSTFCSRCNEEDSHTQSPNDGAISLTCHESRVVLEELADCVVCSEYGAKVGILSCELNLRRNAIIVLSFLASSGKCGFKCFLFHKLSNKANFLVLILKVLMGEIDAEALESCPASEVSKERTLLMREALILLNRLASHPAYSATVLQELTSCRDMVSLAIDTATRLSKKSRRLLKTDRITKQMREVEVVDLACLFRKRIFTFLGESISS